MIKEIFTLQNPWRNDNNHLFQKKSRHILSELINQLDNKKILGLVGSRQVGKSSIIYLIIEHLLKNKIQKEQIYYFNLDDQKLRELFNDISTFLEFLGKSSETKFIFIDEIQRLESPGIFLKEIHDLGLNLKIVYSGSSQLEIKAKLKEYMVGRARQFTVNRLSLEEYYSFNTPILKKSCLEEILIYGSYPEVSINSSIIEKKLILKDIYQSYLEKDITDFLNIGNTDAFNRLLILLANQISNLLNIDNLSKALRVSRPEIERYITILEQTFIIKRVYPFYQNYKKEIIKTPKIYFLDIGLRNFLIQNFNEIELRDDIGKLFENLVYIELLQSDIHALKKINFWRTTNQTEIDFIISEGNRKEAIEVKWNSKTQPKAFQTLQRYYPEITTSVISKDFFL